jgi:hypothetical protein
MIQSESIAEAGTEASAGGVSGIEEEERLALAVQRGGAREPGKSSANNHNHARNLLFLPKKRKMNFISLRRDRAKTDFP